MRLNFFAPKNYYGSHILAFSGWADLCWYNLIMPLGENYCGGGMADTFIFSIAMPAMLFNLALIFYILELFAKSKVKNRFFLENKVYDVFFDIGMVLCLVPIVWEVFETCKFDPRPFVIMFLVFVAIRVGKALQRHIEKKE